MARRRVSHSIPRVTIHEGGSATLAGVNYRDLRSLFDGAALHAYDALKKAEKDRKLKGAERAEHLAYYRQEIQLLEAINEALLDAIRDSFPSRPERKPTKAERLAAVTEERKERQLLDSLINNIINERRIAAQGA